MYPNPFPFRSQRPGCFLFLGLCCIILAGCEKPFLELHDGHTVSFDEAADSVLVVNVWAEWCAPCRHEIPELNRLAQESDVIVLGRDFDGHQGEALSAVAARMGIEFPQLQVDPSEIWPVGMARALPVTYVFTEGTRHAGTLYGAQTLETLRAAVARARAGEPFDTSPDEPSS